jgi:hypothetical protein
VSAWSGASCSSSRLVWRLERRRLISNDCWKRMVDDKRTIGPRGWFKVGCTIKLHIRLGCPFAVAFIDALLLSNRFTLTATCFPPP